MLRFRPIAPKPATGDVVYPSTDQEISRNNVVKNEKMIKTKRKYVRARARPRHQNSTNNKKRKIKDTSGDVSPPTKSGIDDGPPPDTTKTAAVTLQLLPKVRSCDKSDQQSSCNNNSTDSPYTLNNHVSLTETRIIVECVTDTFTDTATIGYLGFTDKERISNLETDTCPGFVSEDGTNNVVWVNQAYREMFGCDHHDHNNVFRVRLVVNESLPQFCPSFSCRVRLVEEKGQGQKWNSRIVPCDVWRMECFGGFAWKLDVETALGLSI